MCPNFLGFLDPFPPDKPDLLYCSWIKNIFTSRIIFVSTAGMKYLEILSRNTVNILAGNTHKTPAGHFVNNQQHYISGL